MKTLLSYLWFVLATITVTMASLLAWRYIESRPHMQAVSTSEGVMLVPRRGETAYLVYQQPAPYAVPVKWVSTANMESFWDSQIKAAAPDPAAVGIEAVAQPSQR